MMKSFFKKLAFVMALAMVVSMAAPAATTASAANDLKIAYQNGSAISEVNLAKVGDTEDLKFLGAPNWKELGVTWTSNNEAVATVDKAGVVTAISAGTAVIAVQIGSDVATVMVNVVDLPTYTATMGTTDDRNMTELTLEEEGDTFDLAFFGIKDYDKNRYNCNWYSVDESVATVDAKGLVTATGAGKTVISLGVYNVVTGKKHVVDSCEVVVGGAEPTATPTPEVNKDAFEVAQADTDKFVLDFEVAKTVEEINENLEISVKIGEKNYPISFENVAVNGNVATVTTYSLFENAEEYTLTYGSHTEVYTIILGEIAKVSVDYYTGKDKENRVAFVAEEEENDYVTLVPVLYDQYGNDITDKYDMSDFDFNYEVSSNVKAVPVYNDVYAFGESGVATIDITATWITDDGELKVITDQASFAVQKRGKINLVLEKAGILSHGWVADDDKYTYEGSDLVDFQMDPNSGVWDLGWPIATTIPYRAQNDWRGAADDLLGYTAVFKDNRGNLVTSNDTSYLHGTFNYESTNNEVLSIDADGMVKRNKPGKANILVYFTPADGNNTKKLVASTLVTLTPDIYPASFKLQKTSQSVASHVIDTGATVTFKFNFYDQFGENYTNDVETIKSLIKVEARDSENDVPVPTVEWDDRDDCKYYSLTFRGSDFIEELGTNAYKTFNYKITLEDSDILDGVKTRYAVFSLTVKDTEEECAILSAFLDAQEGGANPNWTETITDDALRVKAERYKFNVSLGGNFTKDVAVKNVVGYSGYEMYDVVKTHKYDKDSKAHLGDLSIAANYLSSGNLKIAKVPADLLQEIDSTSPKTGHSGYVYYKVSAPSKTYVAGKALNNTRNSVWSALPDTGKVKFTFNGYIDGFFQHAAEGNYNVSFYTTRNEGGNLYNVKTSSATVTNSSNTVKYLGLNPEFEGVTETVEIDKDMSTGNIERLIDEQLLFSFEEMYFGEYYELGNAWSLCSSEISIDWDHEGTKVTISNDGESITISSLVFDIKLDDANDATDSDYYKVRTVVGARIKKKMRLY